MLSSLDVVEEKLNAGTKSGSDIRELYLGMLYSLETHKMYITRNIFFLIISNKYFFYFSYGYVTNTKIIFVVIIDSTNTAIRDNEIRSVSRYYVCIELKLCQIKKDLKNYFQILFLDV